MIWTIIYVKIVFEQHWALYFLLFEYEEKTDDF